MKRNIKPTSEEKQIANEMQKTPNASEKPVALNQVGVFTMLMQQPTIDAKALLGGGKVEWINAMENINPLFPTGGQFSRPFFVVRAWYFESKTATQKSRAGFKLVTPDENIWHISLPYPLHEDTLQPIYADRETLLNHFENSTVAVGLMQFEKVDRGQNNTYWRFIYSDEHSMELAGEPMPTPGKQAETDDEMPPF